VDKTQDEVAPQGVSKHIIYKWVLWSYPTGRNINDSMVDWDYPLLGYCGKNAPAICLKLIGKAYSHCPGMDRNADD